MPGSENSTRDYVFYYVYVLESLKIENKLYVGSTPKLRERIAKHNRAINFSTKPYSPWQLIFFEGYISKADALRREKYLKTNQGSRLLKRMLKEFFYNKKPKN
jgi:putative endonuclease